MSLIEASANIKRMRSILSGILYTWGGIVTGVSFMDAPRKFKTPSLKRTVAFDVGRVLFSLLHKVEKLLFVITSALSFIVLRKMDDKQSNKNKKRNLKIYYGILIGLLAFQQLYLSPILMKRIETIIAGKTPPTSIIHLLYVSSEAIKLIILWLFAFESK
eukprot:UN11922